MSYSNWQIVKAIYLHSECKVHFDLMFLKKILAAIFKSRNHSRKFHFQKWLEIAKLGDSVGGLLACTVALLFSGTYFQSLPQI